MTTIAIMLLVIGVGLVGYGIGGIRPSHVPLNKAERQVLAMLYRKHKRHSRKGFHPDRTPIVMAIDDNPDVERRKPVPKRLMKELAALKLVEVHGNFQYMKLTEKGYIEATKWWSEEIIDLLATARERVLGVWIVRYLRKVVRALGAK